MKSVKWFVCSIFIVCLLASCNSDVIEQKIKDYINDVEEKINKQIASENQSVTQPDTLYPIQETQDYENKENIQNEKADINLQPIESGNESFIDYNLDERLFYDPLMIELYRAIQTGQKELIVDHIDITYLSQILNDMNGLINKSFYKYAFDGFEYSDNGVKSQIILNYNEKACEDIQTMLERIDIIAQSIFSSEMSEEQKIFAAYTYLQKNVVYDEAAANILNDDIYSTAHNGYGAIIENKAVCEGYACAFNALVNTQNIETRLVESQSMRHMWSMVMVNDQWYHCDVTYDDSVPDIENRANYDYFLRNDDYMSTKDIGRMVLDKPTSNALNYHYNIYSALQYNINGTEYVYQLINGSLIRDEIADGKIAADTMEYLANNITSWMPVNEDYAIICIEKASNKIYKIDFDGQNKKELGTLTAEAYLIHVEKLANAYTLECITQLNGQSIKIEVAY